MCHKRCFFMGLLAAATAGILSAIPVAAQQSAPSGTKVLYDDDRVRVQEVTFKPGDQGPNVSRPFRIIRVLQGGTMRRSYGHGLDEDIEYRTGDVKVFPAEGPFIPKNMGQSDIVLYVVALKEPKRP